MARDSTLAVRRAILAAAKADTGLTALVPADSIYPQSPPVAPAWPFVKYGAPSGVPLRATCVDGVEFTVALHGFSKGRTNGAGQLLETAEDHAARIGGALAAALDGKRIVVDGLGSVKVRWTGLQLLQDGDEAGAFHTVQNYRVRVIS